MPIEISTIPGLKMIKTPKNPIINAKDLYKYIFSFKNITARIVTIKGTTKCIAVIFSKGRIANAANPKSIAGKFNADLKICIFKFEVLKTLNLVLRMYGIIIKKPKKNLKKPVVNTFNSSWANLIKVPINVPKIIDIIIRRIANWFLFNKRNPK